MPHEIRNPIARRFFDEAATVIKSRVLKDGVKEFPDLLVRQGQPEFNAWADYFEQIGWTPVAMQMAMTDQNRSFMAPTRWPHWFDQAFTERAAAE